MIPRTALNQSLSQNLLITPQLQQALKVLQCGLFELAELVDKELLENPLLERENEGNEKDGSSKNEADENSTEKRTEEDFLDSNVPSRTIEKGYEKNGNILEQTIREETTLERYLLSQVQELDLKDSIKALVTYIIGNLNENGYLDLSCEEISNTMGVSMEDVKDALEAVQALEPAGVGARNLKECLLLQLAAIGREHALEGRILELHLELLEQNKLSEIARLENVDVETVRSAVLMLHSLNPFPGNFISNEKTGFVIPDVKVKKVGDEYVVLPNSENVPWLRLGACYRELYEERKSLDKDSRSYLSTKMRGATWLMRCLAQREQTVRKVSAAIVKHQQRFFENGPEGIMPLTLKEIGEEIRVHESTVSRAISNKFMETPRGILEFKYFFAPGIKTSKGAVTTSAIKQRIKGLIEKERVDAPMSDQELSEILKSSNISIARRTVTKYREALGIASSSLRRNAGQAGVGAAC